jgi:hypothetical protein
MSAFKCEYTMIFSIFLIRNSSFYFLAKNPLLLTIFLFLHIQTNFWILKHLNITAKMDHFRILYNHLCLFNLNFKFSINYKIKATCLFLFLASQTNLYISRKLAILSFASIITILLKLVSLMIIYTFLPELMIYWERNSTERRN